MRAKGSKDQISYWKDRIRKNTYTAADGAIREQQDFMVQIGEHGIRKTFSLRTANSEHAAKRARDIYQDVQVRGLQVVHRDWMRPKLKGDLTLTKFTEVYREALQFVDSPPLPRTANRYVEDFLAVASTGGAKTISELSRETVDRFKSEHRKKAREGGKDEYAIRNTINRKVRQAKCLFSKELIGVYSARYGLNVEPPFEGVSAPASKVRQYEPLKPEQLDTIWEMAPLLRDGDPDALPAENGERIYDLTQPNPAAYLLLLLELTSGLRRNEADKAEWSWITETDEGATLTVTETRFFKPKTGEVRTIRLQPGTFTKLKELTQSPRFIVPGNDDPPKLGDPRLDKRIVYRCNISHATLCAWLHRLGISGNNPCHRLRKEFGSYVATHFSLFHAQKMLGHSDPSITAKHYAGLTDHPSDTHWGTYFGLAKSGEAARIVGTTEEE